MARFTTKEQTEQRKAFIADCMLKAWGAACHADWMQKSLNELIAEYQRLQAEDKAIEGEIKANLDGLAGHTVENRNIRAELQKKRNVIGQKMKLIAQNTQQGATAMQRLLDSVDQNLLLADFAKDWEWKEVEEPKAEEKPKRDIYVLQKDWSDRVAGETVTREEVGDGKVYKDMIKQGIIVED